MSWTCEQLEARLSDHLDGVLSPADREAFLAHSRSCARCAPLVAGVSGLITSLHTLEPVEASPRLVYGILDKTLGPRESVSGWRLALAWLRNLASPKFAYGALSVTATLGVLLAASGFSWRRPRMADLRPAAIFRNADRQAHLVYARSSKFVSDLRVVYEIQSRLRPDAELSSEPDKPAPQSAPQKQPGISNGPDSSPRQQNRANGLRPDLAVLAAALPPLTTRSAR
jgi:anti-sigma factor RsiW